MRMWIRVVPALLVLAASALAQTSGVIDEGSFTFTRAGSAYGTESFKIVRRLGAEGIEYVAHCTRTIDGKIVKTALTTDSAGSPTAYTRSTTGAGAGQISARRALNRLTVNEEGSQASSRDYVFGPGTLILDGDVIHQLYFVTWRDPRSLEFVAPGGRTSGQAALTEVVREDVVIGGATIPAIKFALGTGDDKREIWIDFSKRLLKVAHPALQIVGTRDLPPRY
jgi:hypothetical protein